MANTVGPLIKEARGKAKLSQEALAAQIEGLSASDLGKAERGEKELSQSVLKQIAKLTGVTQSSLINAAKESTYGTPEKKTAAKKTTASTTEKKTTAKTTAKKTASASSEKKTTAKKTTASKNTASTELTATEKKLVELYRAADADTKKKAMSLLKGEQLDIGDILSGLISAKGDQADNGDLLGGLLGMLKGK